MSPQPSSHVNGANRTIEDSARVIVGMAKRITQLELAVGGLAAQADLANLGVDLTALTAASPRGLVASVAAATTYVAGTSYGDITGASVTFTAQAGRRYMAVGSCLYRKLTSANLIRFQLLLNGTVVGVAAATAGINEYGQLSVDTNWFTGSGSTTVKAQGQADSHTGEFSGVADAPTRIAVFDVGPS